MSSLDVHPAALNEADLLAQLDTRRQRRSGPGGQHRNKVETGVFLRHEPTGVTAEATERRSQHANLRVALFRLRVNLALEVRRKFRIDVHELSDLWRQRCVRGHLSVSTEHEDFPAILAEALDVVSAVSFDVGAAAHVLKCTSSQLVKLLRSEPRALAGVNDQREARGLRSLR